MGEPAEQVTVGGVGSTFQLTERLRQRRRHPRQARSTALCQLATGLSAKLLAHMLAINGDR